MSIIDRRPKGYYGECSICHRKEAPVAKKCKTCRKAIICVTCKGSDECPRCLQTS